MILTASLVVLKKILFTWYVIQRRISEGWEIKNVYPFLEKKSHWIDTKNSGWTFTTYSLLFPSPISYSPHLYNYYFFSYSVFPFGLSPQPVPLEALKGIAIPSDATMNLKRNKCRQTLQYVEEIYEAFRQTCPFPNLQLIFKVYYSAFMRQIIISP